MDEEITIPVAYLKSAQADLEQERALADRLAGLVERLERKRDSGAPWSDWTCCRECRLWIRLGVDENHHEPDCALAAALAEWRGRRRG